MIIKNALVYTDDFQFASKDVCMEGEHFCQESHDAQVVDATGLYAIPGLVDIHLHGCVGHDFCDGTDEALDAMCAYEGKHGVTAINPASMTLSEETLSSIFENASHYTYKDGAMFVGINMEGPFFNPAKKGAQNGAFLHAPDVDMFHRLQEKAQGLIRIACIAPEVKGSMDFIREASKHTTVSIAHTAADYDTASEAFHNGADHVTHLYNAMPPLSHRAPGVIGAALDANADAEIICDGVHIHPSAIRAAFRMFGDEHLILISDSMMATGLDDGMYSLGGQPVKVCGNHATLEDGTLAGSVTNLFDCMKCAVSFGIPLESAVKMASWNPTRSIGLLEQMGSITPGKVANLILMDRELNIKAVYVKGRALTL